jgi:hypothetical protein
VNNLPFGPVLPGMRIHRQNSLPGPPAAGADHPTDQSRRLRWRPRRLDRGGGPRASESDTGGDQAVPAQALPVRGEPGRACAAAVQLVIALLTAGLDSSPELEAWAADTLTPVDADGLGDFMAGLHVISLLLLTELHEATGEPPGAILQRLALLAEHWRGPQSDG